MADGYEALCTPSSTALMYDSSGSRRIGRIVAWLLSPEKRGEEVEVRRKEGGIVIFAAAGFGAVVVVVAMVVVVVKGVCGSRAWKASTSGRGAMRSSRDGASAARKRS